MNVAVGGRDRGGNISLSIVRLPFSDRKRFCLNTYYTKITLAVWQVHNILYIRRMRNVREKYLMLRTAC